MCSLVMSLCSHDTLNGSRLTVLTCSKAPGLISKDSNEDTVGDGDEDYMYNDEEAGVRYDSDDSDSHSETGGRTAVLETKWHKMKW